MMGEMSPGMTPGQGIRNLRDVILTRNARLTSVESVPTGLETASCGSYPTTTYGMDRAGWPQFCRGGVCSRITEGIAFRGPVEDTK
jgi:hypothetical protein